MPCLLYTSGQANYRGRLELVRREDGIVVINELPLEEYLYGVVPGEMPASYPLEALKSQAICARTYAYERLQRAGLPEYGAHVDDSTAFQVYQNLAEQGQTTQAVKETSLSLIHICFATVGVNVRKPRHPRPSP